MEGGRKHQGKAYFRVGRLERVLLRGTTQSQERSQCTRQGETDGISPEEGGPAASGGVGHARRLQ